MCPGWPASWSQLCPPDDRAGEPEPDECRGHDRATDGRRRRPEDEVADQPDRPAHRDRQHGHPDQGEVVGDRDDVLLLLAAEEDSMADRRRGQENRRQGDCDEHTEVELLLEVVQIVEPVGEGNGQQEGEQNLDTRQRHSQLLEQIGEVAVGALLLGLEAAALQLARLVLAGIVRRHAYFCTITTMPRTIAPATMRNETTASVPAAVAAAGRSSRAISAERVTPKTRIAKTAVTPIPATSDAITVSRRAFVSMTVASIQTPTPAAAPAGPGGRRPVPWRRSR